MKTGKPVALREGENLDITLPLHEATGALIGAIGLTFTPRPGEPQDAAVKRAQAIAKELERQIPFAGRLFEEAN